MKNGSLATSLDPAATEGPGSLMLPLVVAAANFTNAISTNVYAALATNLSQRLSLSGGETGLLMSAFTLGYAGAQIPGGIFSAKFGRRQVLIVSLAITGVIALLFGVLSDFRLLFLTRFLMGFSSGAIFPTSNHTLSEFLSGRKLQLGLAFFVAGYGVGTVFTFFVLSLLLQWGDWRWMMAATAMMNWLTALGIALLMRGPSFRKASLPSAIKWSWRETVRLFANVNLIHIGLIALTAISTQIVVLTWTPAFLQGQFASGALGANLITGVMGISFFISALLGDRLAARLNKRLVIVSGIAGCVIFPTVLAVSPAPWIAIALVGVIGWFSFCYFAPLYSIIPRFTPRELTGVGAGYVNTISFLGTFITPFAFGLVLDHSHSYLLSYAITSLVAVPGIISFVALARGPARKELTQMAVG